MPRRVRTETYEFVVFEVSDELRQVIERVLHLSPKSAGVKILNDLSQIQREMEFEEVYEELRTSLVAIMGTAADSHEFDYRYPTSSDLCSFVLAELAPTGELPGLSVDLVVGITGKVEPGGYARFIFKLGSKSSTDPSQAGYGLSIEFVALEYSTDSTSKIIKKFQCQRALNGSWAAFDTRDSGFDLPPNSRLCILASYQAIAEIGDR